MQEQYELREGSHAGSWYVADPKALSKQLDAWIKDAHSTSALPEDAGTAFVTDNKNIRAIISPHAGFSYSGKIAAEAYRFLPAASTKRIILLGPSHHYYLDNCALSAAKYYDTPLGRITIDQKMNTEILKKFGNKFSIMTKEQDEEEHSLEMQLPFILRMMQLAGLSGDDFVLVPVLVGSLSSSKERIYGQIFSEYLNEKDNFLVISSDFCHWGSRFQYTYYLPDHGEIYQSIEYVDKQGMRFVASKDLNGFQKYLRETENTICGRHPIAVLLGAIECLEEKGEQEKFEVRWVQYAQSSQVRSRKDSSVSYGAAVCCQTTQK